MNKEKNMSNKRVVNDNNKSLCFKKFESLWSLGPKVQKTKMWGNSEEEPLWESSQTVLRFQDAMWLKIKFKKKSKKGHRYKKEKT